MNIIIEFMNLIISAGVAIPNLIYESNKII